MLLSEHVQPVSRTVFAMVKHCITGWSKQKWVSLRAYSKVPNRSGCFPWVKRITISYSVFLYPSHLPVLPQTLFSREILRSDVIHWVGLHGLNPCSVFLGGIGLELPPVAACPKPLQVLLETERGARPVAELLVDLCALNSWSTFEIADAKHLMNSVEAKFAYCRGFLRACVDWGGLFKIVMYLYYMWCNTEENTNSCGIQPLPVN